MIFYAADDDSLNRDIDIADVGNNRTYSCFLQSPIGSLTHTTGQQYLAIRDVREHSPVFLRAVCPKSPAAWIIVVLVIMRSFLLEVAVTDLLSHFAFGDQITINCHNDVLRRPSKMLADRIAIIGNGCYFHFHGSFLFCLHID